MRRHIVPLSLAVPNALLVAAICTTDIGFRQRAVAVAALWLAIAGTLYLACRAAEES